MPSPIAAVDLINSSARLAKVLASGETLNANELSDSLLVLNDILEQWSTNSLAVWGEANETFNLIAGQSVYTIGPGGAFNTVRPVAICDAYCNFGGVDFHINQMSQEKYNLISLKTMAQPIVEQLLYVNDFPLGLITVWPVPTQAIPITLSTGRVLSTPVVAATLLTGPPGYLKALRYALAVELGAEFGVDPSPVVLETAAVSMADYKRSNITVVEARFDDALTVDPVALYQRGY